MHESIVWHTEIAFTLDRLEDLLATCAGISHADFSGMDVFTLQIMW